MKHIFLTILLSLIYLSVSFGQGIIRGKVFDENGETVIGASINLKANSSIRAMTDFDGNFSLKIPDPTPQIMVVTFIGYKPSLDTVNPKNGEIIIRNIKLSPVSQTLKEVEIVAQAVKAKDNFMITVKKKSPTLIDYISAESIRKIGDVNVSSAIARVVGVSTNGSFITVRGIGDRYIKTAINGSRIPTLDAFTNNIKLDLFPASLVDNIVITKTASPDLPGDWAGAYLSVETKDYPDKLAVNFETSIGYNNQTTFKDVLSTQHSNTDWLGYDNGFRDYNHQDYTPTKINPDQNSNYYQYDEFVALGLGDYYKSLGVTKITPWNETYYKMGLVRLGLLGDAQFNDPNAVALANERYEKEYKGKAFDRMNADAVNSNKSFANNWNTTTRKAPLNFSQSFSIGDQINLFGKPLGFIAGFRYSTSIQYDPNSIVNKYDERSSVVNNQAIEYTSFNQKTCQETNGWSGLVNVAYKFNRNNSLSLLFMPNVTGVNKVRSGWGESLDRVPGSPPDTIRQNSQFYESRKQLVYQLKSDHYFPGTKIKIELNASYTNGNSNAPDFKSIDPRHSDGGYQINFDRYFRYLSENLFDSRVSLEFPLDSKPGLVRKLKFGGAYQKNKKKNDLYDYILSSGPYVSSFPKGGDLFSLDKFNIVTVPGTSIHTVQQYYQEYAYPFNHSYGVSKIKAGFILLDYTFIPSFRLSGGLRVEQANIYTDVNLYNSLGLAPNDERRKFIKSDPINNPGVLDKLSYLPSVNFVYKIKRDELAPVNLRLNYSQTVARPSIRELSDIEVYDYELKSTVTGNPNLRMVQINNYDLRLEWFFKSGDNISMSVFYKDFKNHIELVQFGDVIGYQWVNNPNKSWLKGIELEGKKAITKQLELRANITLVDSRSTFNKSFKQTNGTYVNGPTVTRTMFGQAPYIINGIISYTSDSLGLSATLSYNVQGPKFVIGGSGELPDIYERPRHLLDFRLIKKLGKYFSVSLKIQDILNSAVRRSYKFDQGFLIDYDRYNYGTNYVLGILYKF